MTKTRRITEIGVCVAMAVVGSLLKVWEMPQGGSVALTMVPILMISIKRGALSGITTGAIYGVLSLLIAGVIYHPMSIILDYVLAFGLLGLAGLFKQTVWGVIIGRVVGVFGRFLSSLVSGAVLFGSYAPAGQNPWVYSLIYQATYLVPEFIISTVIIVLLFTKAHRLFEN